MTKQWPIRATLIIAGIVAIAWASYCMPILAKQRPIDGAAKRIVARESFLPGALSHVIDAGSAASADKWQRPVALASQAAVDLRLLERAMAQSDASKVDQMLEETEKATLRALSVTPADPFLWTVLFWVENNRLGFKAAHLNYLRMSYEAGPNEGWVAVSRSRFALALFRVLPPGMADMAVGEFSRLVASGFQDAAIDLLSRQDEPMTSRLLASLSGIDIDSRQSFATRAYRKGYDWTVPGVDRPEWRPWH